MWKESGLMVSALMSRSSRLGSNLGQGHCVVFFGKPLYSHSDSLHPGVEKDTGDGPDGPLGSYEDFNKTSKSSTLYFLMYKWSMGVSHLLFSLHCIYYPRVLLFTLLEALERVLCIL